MQKKLTELNNFTHSCATNRHLNLNQTSLYFSC